MQIYQGGMTVMSDTEWFEQNRITHVISLGECKPDAAILRTRQSLYYDVDGMCQPIYSDQVV
jgi:hypothetical protein